MRVRWRSRVAIDRSATPSLTNERDDWPWPPWMSPGNRWARCPAIAEHRGVPLPLLGAPEGRLRSRCGARLTPLGGTHWSRPPTRHYAPPRHRLAGRVGGLPVAGPSASGAPPVSAGVTPATADLVSGRWRGPAGIAGRDRERDGSRRCFGAIDAHPRGPIGLGPQARGRPPGRPWRFREEPLTRVDVQSHLLPVWPAKLTTGREGCPRALGRGKDGASQMGVWRGKVLRS